MTKRIPGPTEAVGEHRLNRFYILLKKGLFIVEACNALRINRDHVRAWMERGERGDPESSDFAARVREAEADAIEDALTKVRASDDHRAQAWWLERRFPRRWGPKAEADDSYTPLEVEDMRSTLRERLEAVLGKAAS